MKRLAAITLALALSAAGPTFATDADNTARNARDADGTTLLPTDQGSSEQDVAITQRIRQAIVAQDDLSLNARNVKIITIDGVVTLRGPVDSPTEKAAIANLAAQSAGVRRVDDQLEVASGR